MAEADRPHGPLPDDEPARELALSLPQREVWLDQRAWPGSGHLHIGGFAWLHGRLDISLMRESLRLLVQETQALRLAPLPDQTQQLLARVEPRLDIVQMPGGDAARDFAEAWLLQERQQRFVLDGHPCWRFCLLSDGQALHGLSIRFHHLVMDGWGTQLIMQRWTGIYCALQQGRPVPESEAADYADFIASSLAYRDSPAFARDADFWTEALPELPAALLPGRQRNAVSSGLPRAHLARLRLARSELEALQAPLAAQTLSLFDAMMAALALYTARSSGQWSFVVGVPSLNRQGARFRATPGMFASVQPVMLQLDPLMSGEALLLHCKRQMQASLRHARYPLSEIAHRLQLMRGGRASLLDLMLSFERQSYQLGFGDCPLHQAQQTFSAEARYPLALTVCEFGSPQDVELVAEASEACYDEAEAELLLRRLWHMAQALVGRPELALDRYELLPPQEHWALIQGLHKDLARLETPRCYIELFEQQALLQPDAPALVWGERPQPSQTLDYGTLAESASLLAAQLLACLSTTGDAPAGVVALALPRSPAMVIAVLAVAKAGAAFVPLDLESPPERRLDLLRRSGARALIATAALPAAECDGLPMLRLDDLGRLLPGQDLPPAGAALRQGLARPGQPAYLLFTSGSTGTPKGVLMSHQALCRRLAWLARSWGIGTADRSAQHVQLGFDPALIELLLPLIQGASIALAPPGRQHPERLAELILQHGVTFCALVPATLAGLLKGLRQGGRLKLRVACCGGEVLPAGLSNRFLMETGAQLYNVYGPTEACIFATAWPCEPRPSDSELPLGRPVDDTRIYVLDEQLRPQPFGVQGEVYIAGPTLAEGYLDEPALGPAPFMADPFHPGERMYRSGDRGWLDSDGLLHFAGRVDRQVKLRGYRIELAEIEAACLRLPGVVQAAVKRVEERGEPRLHAWLGGTLEDDGARLQALLRTWLPDYMVPAGISVQPSLPLRRSGKIDEEALPPPRLQPATAQPTAPLTGLEQQLKALWEEALQCRPIGIEQNFFDLGGDSLAALSILSSLEAQFQRRLPLQLISEHPSIAALARALAAPQARPGVLLALSTEPAAQRLYIAASGHGDVLRLQTLARALQSRLRVFMLQPPPHDLPESMHALASLYADAIASEGQPGAWLAGFSVGGVSALATACELQRRGMPPAGLVLLDTIHPDAVLGGTTSWRGLGWLVRKLHVQDLSMNGRRLGAMFADPGLVAQVMALRHHRCEAFDGPVLLVKSEGLARWSRLLFRGWTRLLHARLRWRTVRGLHGSIFEPEHVNELADTLATELAPPRGAPRS